MIFGIMLVACFFGFFAAIVGLLICIGLEKTRLPQILPQSVWRWGSTLLFFSITIGGCVTGGRNAYQWRQTAAAEHQQWLDNLVSEQIKVTAVERIYYGGALLTTDQHPERLVLNGHYIDGPIKRDDRFHIRRERGSSLIKMIERIDQPEKNSEQ
jgi:hypothetical protein